MSRYWETSNPSRLAALKRSRVPMNPPTAEISRGSGRLKTGCTAASSARPNPEKAAATEPPASPKEKLRRENVPIRKSTFQHQEQVLFRISGSPRVGSSEVRLESLNARKSHSPNCYRFR